VSKKHPPTVIWKERDKLEYLRKKINKGHSHSVKHRKEKSEHKKKLTK
jgi:predicted RNA-binding protein